MAGTPRIIVVGKPVWLVKRGLEALGYKVDYEGPFNGVGMIVRCWEDPDVQYELTRGGVWIHAPGEGEYCEKGEAYRVMVDPRRGREVELAVRLIEVLDEYLYERNDWPTFEGHTVRVLKGLMEKIGEVEWLIRESSVER